VTFQKNQAAQHTAPVLRVKTNPGRKDVVAGRRDLGLDALSLVKCYLESGALAGRLINPKPLD
jgi:hypothetical protein